MESLLAAIDDDFCLSTKRDLDTDQSFDIISDLAKIISTSSIINTTSSTKGNRGSDTEDTNLGFVITSDIPPSLTVSLKFDPIGGDNILQVAVTGLADEEVGDMDLQV